MIDHIRNLCLEYGVHIVSEHSTTRHPPNDMSMTGHDMTNGKSGPRRIFAERGRFRLVGGERLARRIQTQLSNIPSMHEWI